MKTPNADKMLDICLYSLIISLIICLTLILL